MLDIIFQNKLFDIGLINNIANFRTMFQTLESNGSTDVSSTYAASLDSAKAALEKIKINFEGLEK